MQPIARSFRNTYFLALSLLALLIIVAQLLIQITLANNASDSRIVNLAGRQRMLSQRISKTAVALDYLAPELRAVRLQEITTALEQWEKAHVGLQQGDATLGLPANQNSAAVTALFAQAEPHFQAMRTAARCLIAFEETATPRDDCTGTNARDYITIILENEISFLPLMDQIVFQYDAEAAARVQELRVIEVLLMVVTLAVLILEALFIFRPITLRLGTTLAALQTAQTHLEQANATLEQRVQQRTAELERANLELHQANREINNYATIVSHDLRSPVASVRGFVTELRMDVETLREMDDLPAPARQVLEDTLTDSVESIGIASETMERLTKIILQIARDGRRDLVTEPVDVERVLQGILTTLNAQIEQKQVHIERQALPTLYSDYSAIEQILFNVVSNAIKYLSPQRQGQIAIRAHEAGSKIRFSIADNGRGIAPEEYERVFQLFRRAGLADVEGEGVGLYFTQALVQRLGGRIWFESVVEQGTTFYIELPKQTTVMGVQA
jgi:signal transduction histidine kinase